MVRLCSLPLLALLSGTALALYAPEQQLVLDDAPIQVFNKWSYVDCGLPTDPIQLELITLSPDPPVPGKDLTVTVIGTAATTVEEGAYADVTVKLGIIKLLTKTFDICHEARQANASIQCPVEEGDYVVQHTVALPKEIPQAKFTVNVRGYTVNDDDLICLDINVDFMKLPWW